MKKRIIILFSTLIVLSICLLCACKNKKYISNNSDLAKVKVAEVAHTIFYAPAYAAISKGYFKEEKIDIDLTLTAGADKVSAAVLSGDVDVGFCGSEATIYVYQSGEKDYLVNFARLTKKDGAFLVSRKKYNNFTLEDLKNKYVIGGRKGGMPEMTFEWALRENNIDPTKDLTIDTSIAFASMEGAFIGGTGDFVTLFEPNASKVEQEGLGYIVAYVGELGGSVPYTSYSARKSYIEENPKTIKSFSNAINKALVYIEKTDIETLAKDLEEFFPDTTLEDIEKSLERYRNGDAWRKNITITEKEFEHIEEIIKEAGIIDTNVPYKDLIYTKYFKDYE